MIHRWSVRTLLCVCSFISLTCFADAPLMESVPGEFVITVRPEFALQSKEILSGTLGVEVVRRLSPRSRSYLIRRPMVELQTHSVSWLQSQEMVEIAEPNYLYRHFRRPNDDAFSRQWGMLNDGSSGRKGVDIGAERAWDIHAGAKNIIVAVIDTGVDYTIADLAPNMWINQAEAQGVSGVDDDGNGYIDDIYGYDFAHMDADPMDDHSHGSHCAGTIGAKGNDGQGIAGVNWNVQIMALKFIKAQGGGTLEAAIASIDYAVANGATVLSNSWGGGSFSQQLMEAIVRAEQQGVLFVAAAGNSGTNNDDLPNYPASFNVDNIISVAAVDSNGKMADFSCFGEQSVHIGAPGVGVVSTTPRGLASMDGTSMAAPFVAGVAALVWSHDSSLNMSEVRSRILRTAKPFAGLNGLVTTGGMVNAYYAVSDTLPPADPNDPEKWQRDFQTHSSIHPYPNDQVGEWRITVPGAKRVALHFSKIATEKGYDYIEILNVHGELIERFTGHHKNVFSVPVVGDTIEVRLIADRTQNGYGFDINFISYE